MKIYLASSWKNEHLVRSMANYLTVLGHEVDDFTNDSNGRFTFSFNQIPNVEELDAKSVLNNPLVQRAYQEDKKWLDWSEIVIMILPCGKSAHLEAGYIKGSGKKLIIYSFTDFPKGEFDVMYGFANLITNDIKEIEEFLEGA